MAARAPPPPCCKPRLDEQSSRGRAIHVVAPVWNDRLRGKDRPMNRNVYRAALEALEGRRLLSAGDLDITFAGDGAQSVDLPGSGNESANATVVQSDGKVILA